MCFVLCKFQFCNTNATWISRTFTRNKIMKEIGSFDTKIIQFGHRSTIKLFENVCINLYTNFKIIFVKCAWNIYFTKTLCKGFKKCVRLQEKNYGSNMLPDHKITYNVWHSWWYHGDNDFLNRVMCSGEVTFQTWGHAIDTSIWIWIMKSLMPLLNMSMIAQKRIFVISWLECTLTRC